MIVANRSARTETCKMCNSTVSPTGTRSLEFVNIFLQDLVATQSQRSGVFLPVEHELTRNQERASSSSSSDSSQSSIERIPSSSSRDSDEISISSTSIDSIPMDLMTYGTTSRDIAKLLSRFDAVICQKIMPMAVRLGMNVEDKQNVLLSYSKDFVPLHHAICAITLLDSGMEDRPERIAGSFKHYDQAITACRSIPPSADPHAVFFLHFILLTYDIACASQRWSRDCNYWALHLPKLASLAHVNTGTTVSRLKAYLSWYILLLDAQAGLAGNSEAGHYTRTFLVNGRCLPRWPNSLSSQRVPSSRSMNIFSQVHKLSLMTFAMYAEQSQVSLNLRNAFKTRRIALRERQRHIRDLSIRHAQVH